MPVVTMMIHSCMFVVATCMFSIAVSAQNFSCDADVSKPLCPGTVVTCTCLVTGTVSQTWWTFNMFCTTISFRQIAPCSSASAPCDHYIITNNLASSADYCQISKLFVTMATSVSGLLAECRDMSIGLPGTLIGDASFEVQGTLFLYMGI